MKYALLLKGAKIGAVIHNNKVHHLIFDSINEVLAKDIMPDIQIMFDMLNDMDIYEIEYANSKYIIAGIVDRSKWMSRIEKIKIIL